MAETSGVRDVVIGSTIAGVVTVVVEKSLNLLFAKLRSPHTVETLTGVHGFHFQIGDVLTFIIVSTAVFIALRSRKRSASSAAREVVGTALLRLHTYGNSRTPECTYNEHIFRWYFLTQMAVTVTPEGDIQQFVTSITLFVAFEPDVRITTLRVTSPDIQLPPHEIKEFNQRFAIIVFTGDIPEGTLVVTI